MAKETVKIKPSKASAPELGDFNPHQVHFRNPKTGEITNVKPFRLIIDQGKRWYEYPKGSGNLWWENREFAGRLGADGRPIRGKAHEAWKPPVTEDARIAEKNAVLQQEIAKVQAELAAMKQEQELQKTHPKVEEVVVTPPKAPSKEVESNQAR